MLVTGLRVAHIKVLFTLPSHFKLDAPLLAYVEWFTPFHTRDVATNMFVVSRSTRRHQTYGEVVEADRIVRSCHLMPKYSQSLNEMWSSTAVTELCKTWYFNHYIDYHMYCMVRLGHKDCI